jgi:uncharacterized protein YciI
MLFAFICTDKPYTSALRAKLRPAHIEYMMAVKDRTAFGGPLQQDNGAVALGSIFVIDFDTRADAEAFAANEPYNRGGLFESVVIHRWRQMVPEPHEGFLQEELERSRA